MCLGLKTLQLLPAEHAAVEAVSGYTWDRPRERSPRIAIDSPRSLVEDLELHRGLAVAAAGYAGTGRAALPLQHAIAVVEIRTGNLEGAADRLSRALSGGASDNASVRAATRELAMVLTRMQRPHEAAAVLGPQLEPTDLADCHLMAMALTAAGRYGAALSLLERTRERALRAHTPMGWIVLRDLSTVWWHLGRVDSAQRAWTFLIRAQTLELSPRDPETLRSRLLLASSLLAVGRCREARAGFQRVERLAREELGWHHPDTLACLAGCASAAERLGDVETAARELDQLARRLRLLLGDQHPCTRDVLERRMRVQRAPD